MIMVKVLNMFPFCIFTAAQTSATQVTKTMTSGLEVDRC